MMKKCVPYILTWEVSKYGHYIWGRSPPLTRWECPGYAKRVNHWNDQAGETMATCLQELVSHMANRFNKFLALSKPCCFKVSRWACALCKSFFAGTESLKAKTDEFHSNIDFVKWRIGMKINCQKSIFQGEQHFIATWGCRRMTLHFAFCKDVRSAD